MKTYKRLGKKLQRANERVKGGMGVEIWKKEIVDKLPLTLDDAFARSMAEEMGWQEGFMGRVTRRKAAALAVAQSGDVSQLLVAPGPTPLAPPPPAANAVAAVAQGAAAALPMAPQPQPVAVRPPPQPLPVAPPPTPEQPAALVAPPTPEQPAALVAPPESVEGSGITCVICMQGIHQGEDIKRLPCSHQLHEGCYAQWMAVSNVPDGSCPMRCHRSAGGGLAVADLPRVEIEELIQGDFI